MVGLTAFDSMEEKPRAQKWRGVFHGLPRFCRRLFYLLLFGLCIARDQFVVEA